MSSRCMHKWPININGATTFDRTTINLINLISTTGAHINTCYPSSTQLHRATHTQGPHLCHFKHSHFVVHMVLEGDGSYLKPATAEGVPGRFWIVVFTLALQRWRRLSVIVLLAHTHTCVTLTLSSVCYNWVWIATCVCLHEHGQVCVYVCVRVWLIKLAAEESERIGQRIWLLCMELAHLLLPDGVPNI